jgi:predicted dehydrogenase
MTKIKVGIVGLGEVAQVIHLPILQAQADTFEIAAICDISQQLLHTMGERYAISPEQRYTEALP